MTVGVPDFVLVCDGESDPEFVGDGVSEGDGVGVNDAVEVPEFVPVCDGESDPEFVGDGVTEGEDVGVDDNDDPNDGVCVPVGENDGVLEFEAVCEGVCEVVIDDDDVFVLEIVDDGVGDDVPDGVTVIEFDGEAPDERVAVVDAVFDGVIEDDGVKVPDTDGVDVAVELLDEDVVTVAVPDTLRVIESDPDIVAVLVGDVLNDRVGVELGDADGAKMARTILFAESATYIMPLQPASIPDRPLKSAVVNAAPFGPIPESLPLKPPPAKRSTLAVVVEMERIALLSLSAT